jgi:hypothetical protein
MSCTLGCPVEMNMSDSISTGKLMDVQAQFGVKNKLAILKM